MSEKCKHSVCRSRGLLRCYTCGELLHDEATLREKLAAAEAERDRLRVAEQQWMAGQYGVTLKRLCADEPVVRGGQGESDESIHAEALSFTAWCGIALACVLVAVASAVGYLIWRLFA